MHDERISNSTMKISKVTKKAIMFDNGNYITFGNPYDIRCTSYVDFSEIEETALKYEFDENLSFEVVGYAGFRFGDKGMMFFVPRYSRRMNIVQQDVFIYYKGKKVLTVESNVI